jgi:hypothetical protein
MDARSWAIVVASVGALATVRLCPCGAARAQSHPVDGDVSAAEARPSAAVLHLSEADVLAGFTPEVRTKVQLRDRALALWRSHFAAQADEVRQRFARDPDWRPALADAAALVDDFLETSLLPRARLWQADAGHVWVEKLDPATGQRTQVLEAAPARPVLFAPHEPEPNQPQQPNANGTKPDVIGKPSR